MSTQQIPGLDLREYQHELDEQALDALLAIPAFSRISKYFMEKGLERYYRVQYTGSSLRLTPENSPELNKTLESVCSTLDIPQAPMLYCTASDTIDGEVLGTGEPILMVTQEALAELTEREIRFLFGHQCGYLKGSYGQYQMMALAISSLSDVIGSYSLGIGKLVSQPLLIALLRWQRVSQLSNDRAALLACQDLDAAISLFVKLAGLPRSRRAEDFRDSFIEQARSFEKLDLDTTSKLVRIATEMGRTHPWTVIRASELIKWWESGNYERVLSRQSRRRIAVLVRDGREFCRGCQYRLEGQEQFCPSCGSRLEGID